VVGLLLENIKENQNWIHRIGHHALIANRNISLLLVVQLTSVKIVVGLLQKFTGKKRRCYDNANWKVV